jgi:Uma2 family endonuclease
MLQNMFDPELVAPDRIRPLARKEYDRMVELGMFEDEKIELLRGQLVTMSPVGWQHCEVIAWLNELLIRSLDPAFSVRPQLAFAADNWSEPQPDIAVCVKDRTRRDHPSELLLLIEVSESSLRKDRGLKLRIYAASGVPEYWVVDLQHDRVEVYTEPSGESYGRVEIRRGDDVLRPLRLPGVAISLADMPR